MHGWVIHERQGKLIYEPANYEIDLRAVTGRNDIKLAINSLKQEPFATETVVQQAQIMLGDFLVWLEGQEKVRKVRGR
ncbi:MAG: hypothetical protein ABUL64_02430 [Singulisphaera sp.]